MLGLWGRQAHLRARRSRGTVAARRLGLAVRYGANGTRKQNRADVSPELRGASCAVLCLPSCFELPDSEARPIASAVSTK